VNLDLNLLRVFDVLTEERSVTRAGARLGLTQSAVSHALNRLRYALGDELFVRGPSGMQPTARALDIAPQVHTALLQLQAAVAPADFSPASSERRFTLVASAYVCGVLAPVLVGRMAAEAPLATLAIGQHTADVYDQLDAHRVDFFLAAAVTAPARFTRDVILREELAWVVRADHPLTRSPQVDLDMLAAVPHVIISPGLIAPGPIPPAAGEAAGRRGAPGPGWEDVRAFEAALAAQGLKRRVGVSVPDPFSAMAVVAESDMATLIPKRLALRSTQSDRLARIEPAYASPTFDLHLICLRERLAEPAVAWMRELIRATAAAI
jgi:DNA-binding transcriptional LysR family regulator